MTDYYSVQPHLLHTIQSKLSIVPHLLRLLNCIGFFSHGFVGTTTESSHRSLLVEAHRIIKFMNVPFLTSQQIKDICAEIRQIYSIAYQEVADGRYLYS